MLGKEACSSIFRCPYLMKNIPIAIWSYSDYLLLHNNHVQLRRETKAILLCPWFICPGAGKGTAEVSYLCSAVSGALAGQTQMPRVTHWHIRRWVLQLIWDLSCGCWPQHLYTASPYGPYTFLPHGDWVSGANIPRFTFSSNGSVRRSERGDSRLHRMDMLDNGMIHLFCRMEKMA